jgi:hypothetical protein
MGILWTPSPLVGFDEEETRKCVTACTEAQRGSTHHQYLLTRNIRYEEDLVDQLFQFQRAKTTLDIAIAGSFWQGRKARDRNSQDQPGVLSRDGGYNSLAD